MKTLKRNIGLIVILVFSILLSNPVFGQIEGELKKDQDVKKKQEVLNKEKAEQNNDLKSVRDDGKVIRKKNTEIKSNKVLTNRKGTAKQKSETKGYIKEIEKKHQEVEKHGKLPKSIGKESKSKVRKGQENMTREEKMKIDKEYDEKMKKESPRLSEKEHSKDIKDKKGRELGKQKAEEAHLRIKRAKVDHQNSMRIAKERVALGRKKIEEAKNLLEAEKKAKKISEADYQLKKEKIGRAREAINGLEEKLKAAKELEKK